MKTRFFLLDLSFLLKTVTKKIISFFVDFLTIIAVVVFIGLSVILKDYESFDFVDYEYINFPMDYEYVNYSMDWLLWIIWAVCLVFIFYRGVKEK